MRGYRGQPVERIDPAHGEELNPEEADLIRQVYELYGDYHGKALSRMTHAKGTPWERVYSPGNFGASIPDSLIEKYYRKLAES